MSKLISKKDACKKLGVSGTTLERMMKADTFPKPIKLPGIERMTFAESELDEYINTLMKSHRGRARFRGKA